MSTTKPRICHKCGKPISGYFCPCRRRKAAPGKSSKSSPASRASASHFTFSSSSPITANVIPVWESDPAEFWGQMVEAVRTGVNGDKQMFLTATWNHGLSVHTFAFEDVAEQAGRFWAIPAAVKA